MIMYNDKTFTSSWDHHTVAHYQQEAFVHSSHRIGKLNHRCIAHQEPWPPGNNLVNFLRLTWPAVWTVNLWLSNQEMLPKCALGHCPATFASTPPCECTNEMCTARVKYLSLLSGPFRSLGFPRNRPSHTWTHAIICMLRYAQICHFHRNVNFHRQR